MKYSTVEIQKYYTNILTDLAEKFPNFGEYILNPLQDRYDLHNGEWDRNKMSYIRSEDYLDFYEDIITDELTDYFHETYGGYICYGSYRVCIVADGGIGDSCVLKFSRELWDSSDCCAIEERIYDKAVDCGVSNFFAETMLLGSLSINGKATAPMYIAERFDIDEYEFDEHYSQIDKYSQSMENYDEVECAFEDEGIAATFADAYSDSWEDVLDLVNFLYDQNIRDLHTGNIGFNKNMEPIIIDYAWAN